MRGSDKVGKVGGGGVDVREVKESSMRSKEK